jgi:hypothetical protein
MKLEKLAAVVAASALTVFAAAAFSGASALSLPVAPSAPAAAAEAPVEFAHGCHPNIQRDHSGFHFHTRACVRRNVAPPGLADYYANRRYYRGPICTYRCRFVGPVKTCSQVCR